MSEIIIAVVAFVVGAIGGALFYRRHRNRIEAAAEKARLLGK